MKLILQHLKPHKKLVVLTILLVAVSSVSDLILPSLNATIINDGVMKSNFNVIFLYGGLMVLMSILMGGCSLLSSYCSAKLGASFGRDLRQHCLAVGSARCGGTP